MGFLPLVLAHTTHTDGSFTVSLTIIATEVKPMAALRVKLNRTDLLLQLVSTVLMGDRRNRRWELHADDRAQAGVPGAQGHLRMVVDGNVAHDG